MPNYQYLIPIILIIFFGFYWINKNDFEREFEENQEYITSFDNNEIVYDRQTEKILVEEDVKQSNSEKIKSYDLKKNLID